VAEDRDRLAGLESQTLGYLADVLYLAGSGELPGLAAGSRCDVRFLADRVLFLPPGSTQEAGVIGYPDLEDVEVGGPGRVERFSPGQQAALGLAFGVEGALLAQRATSLKTVVRFQSARCELFVVDSRTAPEVLRMELSRALWAVREARGTAGLPAGVAADPDADLAAGPAAGRASSVVDQLTKLAALLDSGLLTRDEFDRLKADLLAGRAPPD
jgi:Short C-terminal domain